jgi:hypothetical protein
VQNPDGEPAQSGTFPSVMAVCDIPPEGPKEVFDRRQKKEEPKEVFDPSELRKNFYEVWFKFFSSDCCTVVPSESDRPACCHWFFQIVIVLLMVAHFAVSIARGQYEWTVFIAFLPFALRFNFFKIGLKATQNQSNPIQTNDANADSDPGCCSAKKWVIANHPHVMLISIITLVAVLLVFLAGVVLIILPDSAFYHPSPIHRLD